MSQKIFLYLDILGFKELVTNKSYLIDKIFEIINELHVYRDPKFETIVFSDTILIFNNENEYFSKHLCITYLVEYAQRLFIRLAKYKIYFRGILTIGDFKLIYSGVEGN